jgi:hypothetical protein
MNDEWARGAIRTWVTHLMALMPWKNTEPMTENERFARQMPNRYSLPCDFSKRAELSLSAVSARSAVK